MFYCCCYIYHCWPAFAWCEKWLEAENIKEIVFVFHKLNSWALPLTCLHKFRMAILCRCSFYPCRYFSISRFLTCPSFQPPLSSCSLLGQIKTCIWGKPASAALCGFWISVCRNQACCMESRKNSVWHEKVFSLCHFKNFIHTISTKQNCKESEKCKCILCDTLWDVFKHFKLILWIK